MPFLRHHLFTSKDEKWYSHCRLKVNEVTEIEEITIDDDNNDNDNEEESDESESDEELEELEEQVDRSSMDLSAIEFDFNNKKPTKLFDSFFMKIYKRGIDVDEEFDDIFINAQVQRPARFEAIDVDSTSRADLTQKPSQMQKLTMKAKYGFVQQLNGFNHEVCAYFETTDFFKIKLYQFTILL